jgi:hypothetical protein
MCGAVLRYHLAFEGLSKDVNILLQMDMQNQTEMGSGKRLSAGRLDELSTELKGICRFHTSREQSAKPCKWSVQNMERILPEQQTKSSINP